MGCIMMRKCHLNTCPVGVATQDKELRKLFSGKPEHVENYFRFVAEDLREVMASLGFRTIDEMVGRVDKLKAREGVKHWKAGTLDLDRLLHYVGPNEKTGSFCTKKQEHGLERALDNELIKLAKPALEKGEKVRAEIRLRNVNRTVGTMLGSEITRKYGAAGLPEDTVYFKATGTAGQSFLAFAPKGLTVELEGEANDYFGKGLSGGRVILYPPRTSTFDPNANVVVGNVAFYGATSGSAYILGPAGERFAVRNSGASVVVEGVGDHGCEYMTGGHVVVLGTIGRNFAAGMSGGVAYLWNEDGKSAGRVNTEMVDLEELTDKTDIDELKGLVAAHAAATGSTRAKLILSTWDVQLPKFIKVMPRDYKRALGLAAKAKAERSAA